MIGKSDQSVRQWRTNVLNNDCILPESKQDSTWRLKAFSTNQVAETAPHQLCTQSGGHDTGSQVGVLPEVDRYTCATVLCTVCLHCTPNASWRDARATVLLPPLSNVFNGLK